jgi:hypothetical protein
MPHDFVDRADISESELEKLKKSNCGILKWKDDAPSWASQWISVNDKLPNQHAILRASGDKYNITCIGFYDEDRKKFLAIMPIDYGYSSYDLHPKFEVTHWMDLPEPPK